jgi:predicted Zn-ribbon and HTH transcriptional regulator
MGQRLAAEPAGRYLMTDCFKVHTRTKFLDQATYYKCSGCGYEFLSKIKEANCPRCKGNKLESRDIKALAGLDE